MAEEKRKRSPNVSQTWECEDCFENHVFGHIAKQRWTGKISNWHGTGFEGYVRLRLVSRFGNHHVETVEMRTTDVESIISECNQLRRFRNSVLAAIEALPERLRAHEESNSAAEKTTNSAMASSI
jgi:hypothetical protein